jgi:hypothetical protein
LLDATCPLDGSPREVGPDIEEISDDELTRLALAADPEQAIDPGALPLTSFGSLSGVSLPLWYMPPVTARAGGGWRVPIVASVVLALLFINALGLCITYGVLAVA